MLARADLQGIQSLPAASPPPFSGLGAGRPCARNGSRSRLSRRRGAQPPRRHRPPKPALGRRFPPASGVERRRRQRCARRPGRRRGALARRVPPAPAGRRSRTGRKVPSRLAGARRPPDPAVAVLVCRRRRGSGVRSRRSAAGDGRGGRGLRRLRPAGALRRGARFRPGSARPDLGRRAPVAWGRGGEGEAARGLARRRRARSAAELAVRTPYARRAAALARSASPQ